MRTISAQQITDTVARLCIEANTRLPRDVQEALDKARAEEPWPLAKNTLDLLWSNLAAAKEENLPICQDTGMACVFVELGTDVHIDGSFEAAIHEGVRRGYTDGYLRKSIVADPLRRGNTGDNTPAAITVHLVDGDGCTITVAPKGFGSDAVLPLLRDRRNIFFNLGGGDFCALENIKKIADITSAVIGKFYGGKILNRSATFHG